jgi:general secretion pathway protein H
MSSASARTVRLVVKAVMPISAPGNKPRRAGGFTLIELMVVMALVAISVATVAFAIPDPSSTRLEREAARLIAILESARNQARAGAMTVVWVPQSNGTDADYQFLGMPAALMPPLKWMEPEVRAEVVGAKSIVLGPEPVIGPQSVMLRIEGKQIIVGTDGLSPFDVMTGQVEEPPPQEGNEDEPK